MNSSKLFKFVGAQKVIDDLSSKLEDAKSEIGRLRARIVDEEQLRILKEAEFNNNASVDFLELKAVAIKRAVTGYPPLASTIVTYADGSTYTGTRDMILNVTDSKHNDLVNSFNVAVNERLLTSRATSR